MSQPFVNASIQNPFRSRRLYELGKRIVDLSASFFGLLILMPLFAVLAWLIKRDSPGPVFYWGERIGRNGRIFKILKFRTMYAAAQSFNGPKITAYGDSRITPFGHWLRATKLNELPQLWNVLIGDMSIVGPRPEDPQIAMGWPADLREQILSVRPGITSPASIIYRDEENLLSQDSLMDDYLKEILPSKLRLDVIYVRNRAMFADMDVLFWTIYVLITQARQHTIPETSLFWGPLSAFISRFLTWFAADVVVSFASVGLVAGIWRSITPLDIGWRWAPITALSMAVTFSISNYFFKTHLIYWKKASPREILDLAFSTGVAITLMWLADQYIVTAIDVPDGLFPIAGLVAFLGFIGIRYRERILTGLAWRWLSFRKNDGTIGEPLLIVGAGELGEFAAWLVRKSGLSNAFSIIGMVDDDPRKQSMRFDRLRVLGTTQDIADLAKNYDVGLVMFAISNIQPAEKDRILAVCRKQQLRVVMVPDILTEMQSHFRNIDPYAGEADVAQQDYATPEWNGWLDELEALAENGDLDAVRARIAEIRRVHV